ncbi:MAG: DUF1015 domain-containing protein [Actinobacteria bacterium]|nr:DUF1015 domain-containing protein [Actinomycetota bacterium]
MALIRPFKGYRYTSDAQDISTFCSPPYDVLSDAQRDALAEKNPYNAVELELAHGALDLDTPGNRYVTAATTWESWKRNGVILPEQEDALYVVEQRFIEDGKQYARTSIIAEVRLHSFDERVILPHERTLPKALGDRYRLISTTNANFSQVFGLYSDTTPEYTALLEEIKKGDPAACATDADGVLSLLWVVKDADLIRRVLRILADKQVFIADGHHRYTVSLAHRDALRESHYGVAAAEAPEQEGFDADADSEYIMMALSNMDDPQLLVLPYHRAAKSLGDFDPDIFLEKLSENFIVRDGTQEDLEACVRPAFLFVLRDKGLTLAELREGIDLAASMQPHVVEAHCDAWRNLDVSVLQELALDPLFDIHPDRPETLSRLSFSKDAEALIDRVANEESDIAFIMRATRMDQLREVSLAGETMPQKSTYFYPKLPSGFVYRGIESLT